MSEIILKMLSPIENVNINNRWKFNLSTVRVATKTNIDLVENQILGKNYRRTLIFILFFPYYNSWTPVKPPNSASKISGSNITEILTMIVKQAPLVTKIHLKIGLI